MEWFSLSADLAAYISRLLQLEENYFVCEKDRTKDVRFDVITIRMLACTYGSVLVVVAVVVVVNWFMRRRTLLPAGKSVLITGCDRGFGSMLAKHLDSLGYRVFAGCLDAEGEGARQLRKTSSDIVVVQLDVTSDKQVAHAREFVVAAMMNINWLGTVRVTKAFLPLVRAARGRVINLASLAGRVALPGFTSYSSSKFAVIGFSDSLRREMKKFGVRVITIEPSLYRTAIADREALTRQNVHMWGEAAPEVRKQYGESYFRCYLAKLAYVLRYASENVHEVVEDLTHAVSAARPYNRYVPGLFFNQLPADTFSLSPNNFQDFVLGRLMTLPAKPAVLGGRGRGRNVNGQA
ncbi:hypothetical protein BaRGS_00002103 [Batillaria attramentaria]|uniref:Uncharacterized protein n=1 Tax=Batillaria attramentaria TaxID=370345 RepID=A0ABD0M630_9CAEN